MHALADEQCFDVFRARKHARPHSHAVGAKKKAEVPPVEAQEGWTIDRGREGFPPGLAGADERAVRLPTKLPPDGKG